jgi:tripartite ATP-independent transporter DctM subunit
MSPEITGLIGLFVLIALLFAGMWIGAAMAMVGFLGYVFIRGIEPAFGVVAQIPFSTMASYILTTVPLFILMGSFIANTRVGKDLFDTAYTWIGHLRGGLAMATVFACAIAGSILGVSGPAAITMGKVALPAMRRYQYDDTLATASICAAGTLAFLIPPSVAFIIYGLLTEQSIGLLFVAGVFPGILLAFLYALTIAMITARDPKSGPAGPKTSFKEKIISLKGIWYALILFIIVFGGIYGGIFTPTEAGGIGAFGAIIVTVVTRQLTLKSFREAFLDATKTTGMVMLLIIGAYILMKFMAVSKLPFALSEFVSQLGLSPIAVFACIVLLYIILGMFLDIFSAVIVTIPVIYPLILSLGFDPIWFGVIVVILCEIGLITPPVGMDVFQVSGATGVPTFTIFRGVWPFVAASLVCIIFLAIFPQIALFLPGTMMVK